MPFGWFHVAMVYDPTADSKVYINAVDGIFDFVNELNLAEEDPSETVLTCSTNVQVMKVTYSTIRMDELTYWTQPLDADQIKAVYDNESP